MTVALSVKTNKASYNYQVFAMTWKPGQCHKFEFTIGIERRGSKYLDYRWGDVWDQRDARVTYESYSKKDDWHHLAIINARVFSEGGSGCKRIASNSLDI